MAKRSGIEWTEATWNPWRGCTRVSPGCAHCYMFREQIRYGRDPEVVVRAAPATFNAPLKWAESGSGVPLTIFTCSWSDWFHEDADPWRDEAWQIVQATPHHRYLILTKRPERIKGRTPAYLPNVWLGVSVENQRWVERIPTLLTSLEPGQVRGTFVSAEPLLGSVRIRPWLGPDTSHAGKEISWVIAGGESGPGHRAMDPSWARDLRDDCQEFGAAFFLKQLGGWPDKRGEDAAILDGRRWTELPWETVA